MKIYNSIIASVKNLMIKDNCLNNSRLLFQTCYKTAFNDKENI